MTVGGWLLRVPRDRRVWQLHSGFIRVALRSPLVAQTHITRFPLKRIHVTSGLVLIAGLAADNYLPLYIQTTRGQSASFAAFSVLFLTVGWSSAAFPRQSTT